MMKQVLSGAVGAGVFALTLLGWHSYGEVPASYASLVDSVVYIEKGMQGTGVLVAPDKVLTAGHVAAGNKGGVIETRDRRVFAIKEVISSPTMDVALLVLDKPIPNAKVAKLSTVMPVENEALLSIGHPLGVRWGAFRFTFTGNLEDPNKPAGGFVMQGNGGPGLSGGPLFNERGEVVGIATHSMNYKGGIPTGIMVMLPFASVAAVLTDPVKEAMGW